MPAEQRGNLAEVLKLKVRARDGVLVPREISPRRNGARTP